MEGQQVGFVEKWMANQTILNYNLLIPDIEVKQGYMYAVSINSNEVEILKRFCETIINMSDEKLK